MMCSASGTYSLPSAFMKSYWVSTSQKMTRGIPGSLPHNGPGNFSEETGQCQQEGQRLDAQTHSGKTVGVSRAPCTTQPVHSSAPVRLAVGCPTDARPLPSTP